MMSRPRSPFRQFMREVERNYWLELLATHPTRTAAAEAAGVSRPQMYDRLNALDIPKRIQRYLGNAAFRSLSDEEPQWEHA